MWGCRKYAQDRISAEPLFRVFFLLRINEGEIGGYRNKLDRSTLDAEEKGKGSKGRRAGKAERKASTGPKMVTDEQVSSCSAHHTMSSPHISNKE